MSPFNIGFVVFPDLTQLDFTGPLQILSRLPQSAIHIIAKSETPVPSDCGLGLVPTHTFANCPPLDLLCVPGGSYGVVQAIGDRETIEFVRRQAGAAKYVTSVCTGAFILGVAGILKGRRATTHWAFTDLLPLVGATHEKARVVRDGNVITLVALLPASILGSLSLPRLPARELPKQSSSVSNTTRRHRLMLVIPIGHRRLLNQRCYPAVTTSPGQRSGQASITRRGFDRVGPLPRACGRSGCQQAAAGSF